MSDEEHSESEFYYPEEADNGNNLNSEEGNSQEEIESFISEQKSGNTMKKTTSDMKNLRRYLESINKSNVTIESLPAAELDHLLCKFFIDIRKVNGEEYEPDTLSGFQRSIQRFLSDGNVQVNILKDKEFEKSRKVLAAKRKNLVNKAGKGNKPHATRALTDEEEDMLFQAGEFGMTSPEILQRTLVWWFLAMHFGFRARDESRKLRWGDVDLQVDAVDGREMLVWLAEGGRKPVKVRKMVTRDRFSPKPTQPIRRGAHWNIKSCLGVTDRQK